VFEPKYTIKDEVIITISEIERLTSHLKQSIIPIQVLTHIKKECLLALAHFSTQIEGNQLSLEKVSDVVEKQKTYGLIRDEKEVKNYFSKKIDLIIDGGKCHKALPSTIVEIEKWEIKVLRKGMISEEIIASALTK
jgi:Fic family protein